MSSSPSYTPVPSEQQYGKTPAVTHTTASQQRREWQPGVFRRFPWTGILSIILALGCAIAAICIALTSDGQELDHWKIQDYSVQPAVLLSILATLANALLVFAFTQGATIHWWTTAFHGATLDQLHSSFHFGSGLTAIFSSVTAFNTVALAGLFMPILLADGPLLQRSTSVKQEVRVQAFNRTLPLSSSPLVTGATGIMTDHESWASLYHPLFAQILQGYDNRDPILLPNDTCVGNCQTDVIAPGWDISCGSDERHYQLATYEDTIKNASDTNTSRNGTNRAKATADIPQKIQSVFDITVDWGDYYTPGINLTASYKSTPGVRGTMSYHRCALREAIVRYPLRLSNNTVTLGPMPAADNRTVQVIYRDIEMGGQMNNPSTIGGFWLALRTAYKTNALLYPVGGWYRLETDSAVASQYILSAVETLDGVNVTFGDPMDDMIRMANELAFRTALTQSTAMPAPIYGDANLTFAQPDVLHPNLTMVNRTLDQAAAISQRDTIAVYSTHRGYLAGGIVLICLGCILIAPTYWGWWGLGRPVSMSPLEIARAFDAPVLDAADPNATGDDLKREFGGEHVRLAPTLGKDIREGSQ